MQKRILPVWFIIALLAVIALRFAFVVILPFGQTVRFHLEGLNDEPAHFNYVKYLAENHSFPVQTNTYKTPGATIRNDFEYYHPPVYYILGAIGYTAGGGLFFCRMLSFLCGLAGLWLIALILKRLGCEPECQIAGVLLAGIFPCHAYFCALVSNDSMSWLAALAVTYALMGKNDGTARSIEFSWRRSIFIGVVLGFGSLIKSSLLLFYPVVAICFIYSWYSRKEKAILSRMVVSLGMAIVINLPWFFRNLIHYQSITGLSYLNGPAVTYPHLLTIKGFGIFISTSVRFFWFPMQHIPVSGYHRMIGFVGAIIIIALIFIGIRYLIKNKPFTYNHILIYGIFGITIAAYVKYNLIWGNREGRFLYPALSSIVFFFTVPIFSLLKEARLKRLFFPIIFILGNWGYSYLLLTF
jgi:4-amino-4-deoxy-L-arabinose transferase-like glycosyltransferase